MAILTYFEKAHEDDDVVRYRFGSAPDDLAHPLTVHKRQVRVTVDFSEQTYQFRSTARAIFIRFRATGAWPERGMRAS